ncbi:MAG: bifunctional methylenetetrahydrofolate dehydrogenase/methenyltetrahydrofolate cyclohydrolase FolD [Bacillota bacterium]|nr:bifunctional methylenetetrahydrofolate dehydrogenase/methenyltetrahydrofolate cyclohydrolase FolD [Bacillota bacterium]MDI7248483.1 bifunctional methylenetetrahydrofolate dehydrogenase/methenyltetrahydrofolate cyclohydrolase FolD [Bacillota bacterium]
MSARIIDGKAVAEEVRAGVREEVARLKQQGIVPGLAVILVGDDPASKTYVRNKERASKDAGIHSEVYRLPADTPEHEVLRLIGELNARPEISGILLQHPVPGHIDERRCFDAISPEKDVDGFHPVNQGRLLIGEKCFVPCTPRGILHLLDHTGVELKGKRAVVVGRSNIVGKPVALLLLSRHATVTICHSRTQDLAAETRAADVLVVAIGKARAVRGDMIKPGAVVIDVGVNPEDGKLVGDVDFESAVEVASAITPVPGGVGPMTIAMLLQNTVEAARRQAGLE